MLWDRKFVMDCAPITLGGTIVWCGPHAHEPMNNEVIPISNFVFAYGWLIGLYMEFTDNDLIDYLHVFYNTLPYTSKSFHMAS